MSQADDMRLLAMLVHRGLLDESLARAAMQSGDARRHLIDSGAITAAQWQQWIDTAAGTRPRLSRYELGDLLGEGGMARVFRAVDKVDGSTVALKVLRPELSRDETATQRFVREARLLIDIRHPHIVEGRRVAKEGDVVYFAMAEVAGRSLLDELAANGPFDEATALKIVGEIASALDALHARGLVHRDVKPGNILWSEAGGAVLIDLGFAVARGQAPATADTTAGTVAYIAPEQARGSGELDVRADIYALGATLYHLVTGSLPFEGSSSEEVLRKQVLESLSGERIRDLQLSPQLHYLIEKMMAKEREFRFQDPQQLQAEVAARLQRLQQERALEDEAAPPPSSSSPRRPRHRRPRRR